MFAHYRAAFRAPGSVAFCAASFVARMPIAIYPLGLILLFSQSSGHTGGGFGTAGLLEGGYIVACGVGNPLVSRLIDRFGQTRLLAPAAVLHAGSGIALVVLYKTHAPDGVLAVPIVVLGMSYLPIGSLVRSRWSYVLAGRPELGSAYSIESTLDELIFTVGPILAGTLATLVDPLASTVLALVLVVGGSLWLRGQWDTDPPLTAHPGEARRSALTYPGMILLSVAMVGMGGAFGTVEVTVAAFASQHGARSQTGLVLAAFAIGSGLAGLAYGLRQWSAPLSLRFLIQSAIFMALLPLLLLAGNVLMVALLVGVVGLGIAPSLITGFGLVDKLVPARVLTEGLSWVSTGLSVGYGFGAALAGIVAQRHGAHVAFFTPVGAGVLLALAALGLRRRIGARPAVDTRFVDTHAVDTHSGPGSDHGPDAGSVGDWDGALYRDDAVVLRVHKLGEADRIVTLLTRRHGRVRAVGKGVRRTSSKFGARLEPGSHVDVQVLTFNQFGQDALVTRRLDTVTQSESIAAYGAQMASDYPRWTAASAICETAERLTPEEGEPSLRLYLLVVGALRSLAGREHTASLVLDAFFLRAMANAGWQPALVECAICGRRDGLTAYHVAAGGAVCPSCRPAGAVRPPEGTLTLMAALLDGDWGRADTSASDPRRAASGLVAAHLQWHLERGLRSLPFVDRDENPVNRAG